MPKKISLTVKETSSELASAYRKAANMTVKKRVNCLKLLSSGNYVYVSQLSDKIGPTEKTVRSWLKVYREKGLPGLLSHGAGGNAKKVIPESISEEIRKKLDDPHTTVTSYVELLEVLKEEHGFQVGYKTLYSHCRSRYTSRLKVARRSHIKKDPQAGEVFKKT